MSAAITLYGYGGTRSARCRWTLQELGLPFEDVNDASLIQSDRLRTYQPLGKLPAILIDGQPLFESAAICTHLADMVPEKNLIAAPGTRERALHEQWTSFVLTEVEGWLWSNARHTALYPRDQRVPDVVKPNNAEIANGLRVLDDALTGTPYLVDGRFTVTDIIVSWTVNWARRGGHLRPFAHLSQYLERLFKREHCTLTHD